ncbi:hypothetical protein E2C01_054381 [Portunus trituberculatus]|uniref:Uncharacterized protein n=1 Tax=Portunus trituberculatus TaxID=210409 RepID=A0A5B7GRV9_PORTR|nr:hypothetical protein [Portunus trituberculatus]
MVSIELIPPMGAAVVQWNHSCFGILEVSKRTGYNRKTQVRRRTAAWCKKWTPTAANKVGRSKVDTPKATRRSRSTTRWEWKQGQSKRKCSMVSSTVLHHG